MVLTITREEVENLVRQKYALPEDIKILIKETDTHSIPPLKVTVNNDNFVQEIKTEKPAKRQYKKASSKESEDAYERYAQVIEDFLKTDKDFQFIDCEGMSPSGMRYRYNTAIKMYGFDTQCYASATDHNGNGHAKLVRKGVKCTTT